MRMASKFDERGVALVTALVVILLIGALVAGVLPTSVSDYRIGRNMLFQERALAAAEYGQNDVVRSWDTSWVRAMQPGNVAVQTPALPGGGVDTVRLTRLNRTTFWLVSSGAAGSGVQTQGRRRTGVIVRLNTPSVKVMAAITEVLPPHDTLQQSGNAYAVGYDRSLPGWAGCGPAGAAVAGVAAPDTTSRNYKLNNGTPSDSGAPAILETPVAADTSTYSQFGGVTYAQLTSMANVVYGVDKFGGANAGQTAPTLTGSGTCNTANTSNWGEPERPPFSGVVPACYNYFPIIWAKGDLQLSSSSSRGQGILLVDGDLHASGGAEFMGLVIVKGAFITSGQGIKIYGAMMVKDSSSNNDALTGQTVVQYSGCALAAVLNSLTGSAYTMPVRRRAWADMY